MEHDNIGLPRKYNKWKEIAYTKDFVPASPSINKVSVSNLLDGT